MGHIEIFLEENLALLTFVATDEIISLLKAGMTIAELLNLQFAVTAR